MVFFIWKVEYICIHLHLWISCMHFFTLYVFVCICGFLLKHFKHARNNSYVPGYFTIQLKMWTVSYFLNASIHTVKSKYIQEGEFADILVKKLRKRQMRNFFLCLMVSQVRFGIVLHYVLNHMTFGSTSHLLSLNTEQHILVSGLW